MPSDPVTLNDLFVRDLEPEFGDEWVYEPATFDDLVEIIESLPDEGRVEVLEGMGAKRHNWPYGITNGFGQTVKPGSYLVLPLPTPKED